MLRKLARFFVSAASACLILLVGMGSAPPQPASPQGATAESCAGQEKAIAAGPTADVRAFGAKGNGVDDDTEAIYAAIASLGQGGTVLFPPGTYAHADVVVVRASRVTLTGSGAVLHATNPDRAAVLLEGDHSAIRNLAITSGAPGVRGDRDEQSGLVVSGRHNRVAGNTVSGFKNAGILIAGARHYVVTCNRVHDTKSDGIHSTGGASHGHVAWNSVFNSGDDGIAIVSYHPDRQASTITIEDNLVEHIRWGRGISVIGSANAIVRRNRVRSVAMAAGIIVAREASYRTPGARHVTIEDNVISDIQQRLAPLEGRPRTGHGAIELNSDSDDPALSVSDVKVVGNRVDGSAYDGIRLLGNVCRVSISGNRLDDVRGVPIALKGTCRRQVVRCDDNRSDRKAARCR